MNQRYPSVNWELHMNTILPPTVRFSGDSIVNVVVPSYVSDLENIMKDTPARTWMNYLLWRVVEDSIQYLTKDLRAKQLDFLTILRGDKERHARWKECLDVVSDAMSISVGALYVRNHFNGDAKQQADGIMTDIRNGFVDILKQVNPVFDFCVLKFTHRVEEALRQLNFCRLSGWMKRLKQVPSRRSRLWRRISLIPSNSMTIESSRSITLIWNSNLINFSLISWTWVFFRRTITLNIWRNQWTRPIGSTTALQQLSMPSMTSARTLFVSTVPNYAHQDITHFYLNIPLHLYRRSPSRYTAGEFLQQWTPAVHELRGYRFCNGSWDHTRLRQRGQSVRQRR